MPRHRRKQEPGRLYFATSRCLEQRFLLTPSKEINDRILGWLGRAMKRFPQVRLHSVIVLSNHLHIILSSEQVDLDRFIGYWLGNVAKEVNRLRGRRGKVFERRYSASALLDDAAARTKLAYLLLNPTAAKLVADPAQWPGITSLGAQTGGPQLVGYLPDRAELKRRRRRGESVTEADVMVEYPIALTPLPEFEGLALELQQRAVRELVRAERELVERQLAQKSRVRPSRRRARSKRKTRVRYLGVPEVLAQDPNKRPLNPAFSPQPICHASKAETRDAYLEYVAKVERAYDRAMERYRAGKAPRFPPGTRPPGWAWAVAPRDYEPNLNELAA